MSTAFLDEVVATEKKLRLNANVSFTPGSAPRLPHEDINLYGADAGQDYAQTVFEPLKAAIKEAAECKQGKLTIRIPSGGESARRSMEKTIADLLAGFDVSTTNTRPVRELGKTLNRRRLSASLRASGIALGRHLSHTPCR